ncbi:MAG: cation diffusion facilitator family transporter [Eubacteriales bacterium]
MISLLIHMFVKDSDNLNDARVRIRYGKFASIVGMICNIILFAGKLSVGVLSGSIAIVSDSFNNLSDAATCFINLFGFFLSGKPADKDHPFGHGRIEYITGLIMSFLIVLIGFEFLRTSIDRIIHPTVLTFSPVMAGVLLGSILVKAWMYFFYVRVGKRISSQTIIAASVDSYSDIAITLVTLISLLISVYFKITIDGYVGVGVSIFVLYAGYTVAKDALSPLLGNEPDPTIVESLKELLTTDKNVLGVHDVIVHDYGPGRMIASAHVEVSSTSNFMEIHDEVDLLEKSIGEKMHIPITIHMDPIDMDDSSTKEIRNSITQIVNLLSDKLSIHDFRMVTGKTHTNLIFDIAVPFEYDLSDEEIRDKIQDELTKLYPTLFYLVIQFDRSFL